MIKYILIIGLFFTQLSAAEVEPNLVPVINAEADNDYTVEARRRGGKGNKGRRRGGNGLR